MLKSTRSQRDSGQSTGVSAATVQLHRLYKQGLAQGAAMSSIRRSRDLRMEGTTKYHLGQADSGQSTRVSAATVQLHHLSSPTNKVFPKNAATSSICGSRNLRMGCDKGSFEAGREREKDTNLCLKINSFLKEMPARQGAEANVACHCHWARTLYTVFSLPPARSCSPATFLNTSQ
jgi:hypothetical protein